MGCLTAAVEVGFVLYADVPGTGASRTSGEGVPSGHAEVGAGGVRERMASGAGQAAVGQGDGVSTAGHTALSRVAAGERVGHLAMEELVAVVLGEHGVSKGGDS